jgi:hypothetical protein
MSSQAYIFNPTERTSAAAGDGFSAPRLSTADRLALSLGVNGKGMMVYDVTLNQICVWDGTIWLFVTSTGGATIYTGVVDPEGVVTAQPGSIYFNIAIAASPVQFVKGSGTGSTGWV